MCTLIRTSRCVLLATALGLMALIVVFGSALYADGGPARPSKPGRPEPHATARDQNAKPEQLEIGQGYTQQPRAHAMGLKRSDPSGFEKLGASAGEALSLPPRVDLSSQLPPVGNQGQQGSCASWATGYYYKTWSEKREHASWDLTDPTHQFSPSFIYNQVNNGQDSGSTLVSVFSLLQLQGDVDIAEMPYNQSDYTTQPTTTQLEAAKPYRIPKDWSYFWCRSDSVPFSPPNNISQIKSWLANGKALVMGLPIYKDFPDDYGNPAKAYYDYNGTAAFAGGHGVCVVGYNDNANPAGTDADHRGGFKMVNSWGPDWNGANRGFVYLSYDFVKRYAWEAWSMGDLGPDSPSVSGLSTTIGNVGAPIVLKGDNFGSYRRSAGVFFNGVQATKCWFANEETTAYVPAGASSGTLTICDWEGNQASAGTFTVGMPLGLAPTVSRVSPETGSNDGTVTVTITGTEFAAGCHANLSHGADTVEAFGENLVSSTKLKCSFNLYQVVQGEWSITVTNPDAQSAQFADSFQVTGPPPPPPPEPGYEWHDMKGPGNGNAFVIAYDKERDILYRSVALSGIWKYQAGTWSMLDGLPSTGCAKCLIHDSTRNVLYATTIGEGIWRCDNPDTSPVWTNISTGASVQSQDTDAMTADTTRNILYVAGEAGTWRCKNPDTSPDWTQMTSYYGISLAYDYIRDVLYVGDLGYADGTDVCVWRVDDPSDAASWTIIADSSLGGYGFLLSVDSARNVLYASLEGRNGKCLSRCDNPTTTPRWTDMRVASRSGLMPDGVFYDSRTNSLYVSVYYGNPAKEHLLRCDNPGTQPTYVDITGTLLGQPAYGFAEGPMPGTIFIGTYLDGVYRCANPCSKVPAFENVTSQGTISSAAPITEIVRDDSHQALYVATYDLGIWRYDRLDSTPVWTQLDSDRGGYVISLAYDKKRNILYSTNDVTGLWRCKNPNANQTWTNLTDQKNDKHLSSLAYDESRNTLYVGTNSHGVWRCDNPDSTPTWTDLGGNEFKETYHNDLGYDKVHNYLYAGCYDGSVARCENPDTRPNWINIGRPDLLGESFLYDEERDVLYTGTWGSGKQRVWRCSSPAVFPTWEKTGLQLEPYHTINEISHIPRNNTLYAGTSYDGVFKATNPDDQATWVNTGTLPSDYAEWYQSLEADPENMRMWIGTCYTGLWYEDLPVSRVISCDPDSASAGGTYDLSIRGQHTAFKDGVSALRVSGDGVTVNSTEVTDQYTVLANITVSQSATNGPRNLIVETGSEKTDKAIGAFTVVDGVSCPVISDCTSVVENGRTVEISVTGTRTGFSQGNSLAELSGTGITVNSTRVDDPTHAVVNISIAPSTPAGPVDVNVMTGGEVPVPLAGGLAVENPVPTITSIDPSAATLCGRSFSIKVKGSDFRSNSVVRWNGQDLATTYVAPDQVTASVDASRLAVARTCQVQVRTPGPGGGSSDVCVFTVRNPAPSLSSITPASALAEASDFTLTASGAGFIEDSIMRWNGADCPTTFVSASKLTAVVDAPRVATPGTCQVQVFTPGPGGGTTSGVQFTIKARATLSWYLAEGSSKWGFETYVAIENPNDTAVTALITYMSEHGSRERAPLTLPAASQTIINPSEDIGTADFSTRVTCKEGKAIAVDRRMVWTGQGAASQEGHSSIGVTQPAETWFFAEGSSQWGFECWLLIQNPNPTTAHCTVTYMVEGQEAREVKHDVPANSRASFDMGNDIGPADASIKVHSDLPIVPERSMYRYNRREGHDSVGATAPSKDCYLAEGCTGWGFTTYVLVQNPNESAATVSVTYMTPEGPATSPEFGVPGRSRKTIRADDLVDDKDISIRVHGSLPIIAERAMYWGEGTAAGEACHDSIGVSAPHMAFYLPDGVTSEGHETWTLVQNPNSVAVSVRISYLTPSGKGNQAFDVKIPANSRRTFSMGDKIVGGRAAITVTSLTMDKPIVVERSMYWNGRGAGTNTIGGYTE